MYFAFFSSICDCEQNFHQRAKGQHDRDPCKLAKLSAFSPGTACVRRSRCVCINSPIERNGLCTCAVNICGQEFLASLSSVRLSCLKNFHCRIGWRDAVVHARPIAGASGTTAGHLSFVQLILHSADSGSLHGRASTGFRMTILTSVRSSRNIALQHIARAGRDSWTMS